MTPLRQRESLMAEIAGLRQLLQTTEEDPLASPLMRSRLQELEAKLSKLQTQPSLTPEAEIFFTDGPLELSPTPACADQAGTPVVSHVSTETMEKELQDCHATIHKLRTALRRMVDTVEGARMKDAIQEAKDVL